MVAIAQAPADVQREALELVRKRNSAGVIKVLGRAQRLIEGTAQRRSDKNDDKPAVSKFDLATLVYTIDTWSMEMVQGYNPVTDARAASYLTMHLPGAIEKLIALAEANGLAGDVLDAYVARRIAAAQPEPTPEPAPEIPTPEPAPEIPPPEPAPEIPPPEPAPEIPPPDSAASSFFDVDAELRQRLQEHLDAHAGGTTRESTASRIGISTPTLRMFLDGGRIYAKTRTAIEDYLG